MKNRIFWQDEYKLESHLEKGKVLPGKRDAYIDVFFVFVVYAMRLPGKVFSENICLS